MLADVIYYCKLTSFMVLDGVMSFLRLKDVTNTCARMFASKSNYWREFFSAMAESWKKLKTSNVFSSFSAMAESWKKLKTSNVFLLFIVCKNRNRSSLVHELLCNNSLVVGQM